MRGVHDVRPDASYKQREAGLLPGKTGQGLVRPGRREVDLVAANDCRVLLLVTRLCRDVEVCAERGKSRDKLIDVAPDSAPVLRQGCGIDEDTDHVSYSFRSGLRSSSQDWGDRPRQA